MTNSQLTGAAQHAYPGYEVTEVRESTATGQAATIFLTRDGDTKQRLFNPYTGADIGDAVPWEYRCLTWLMDFHDHLLLEETGRWLNAAGGGFFILLGLTGCIIWWPGIKNWRRSLTVARKSNWKQFTWQLHSTLGFWSVALILLWGISGIYLVFPKPFEVAVDYLEPFDPSLEGLRRGDTVLYWLARLHFGRFGGLASRVAWIVLGLAPPVLFLSGALMYWNRGFRASKQNAGFPLRDEWSGQDAEEPLAGMTEAIFTAGKEESRQGKPTGVAEK